MKIALLPNLTRACALEVTENVCAYLDSLNVSYYFDSVLENELPKKYVFLPTETLLSSCDAVIAIGGDGSLIHAAKKAVLHNKALSKMVNKYQADYVIIATGRVPRKLGLDMEEALLNRGISYCATCDGAFYKGKEVAIVGGGDSALTEALYLSDICLKVYVLVRKDLKASDILQNRVKNKDNIVILKNVSVSQFISSDSLTGVLLNDGRKLDVNGLFIAIGGTPDISFLKNLNVNTINGYIKTDDKMRTNIKGLYAVGDVRYKDFYQIITAASDGAIAALSIREDD